MKKGRRRPGSWFPGALLLGSILFLGIPGCGVSGGAGADEEPRVLDLDLLIENTRGGTLRLSEFDGRVRILNFWATWCPPCVMEIPHFNDLVRKYGDRGFQMIGVSLDLEAEAIREFEKETPLEYPSVFLSDELADAVGLIPGLPTSLVVARDGTVYKQYVGYTVPERFEEDLDFLLSGSEGNHGKDPGSG